MSWLLLLAALLLTRCGWEEYDPTYAVPDFVFDTPQDAVEFVAWSIRYVPDDIHDREEYWQSPDQTWEWKTGDCEDNVILAMYILRQEFGGWPQFAGGWMEGLTEGGWHAWLIYDGRWYECQTGADVTDNPAYRLDITYEYGEVLWRAENWHQSVSD
jgi:hypothetical protein